MIRLPFPPKVDGISLEHAEHASALSKRELENLVRADDAAANAGEAQPRQSVLTQRVALSNSITMTRELEHGLSSSNARNRSLPMLENQGSYEHHDWRNREIGSHIEILLRYKENNTSIK